MNLLAVMGERYSWKKTLTYSYLFCCLKTDIPVMLSGTFPMAFKNSWNRSAREVFCPIFPRIVRETENSIFHWCAQCKLIQNYLPHAKNLPQIICHSLMPAVEKCLNLLMEMVEWLLQNNNTFEQSHY